MKKAILFVAMTALMFTITACGGGDNNGQAAEATNEANAEDLKIVATNWDFDKDEYVVEAGKPINFSLENAEGYHTYSVKGLGIEIAGETKQYTINEPGEYEIICSTMCGAGHADMKAKLIVQ